MNPVAKLDYGSVVILFYYKKKLKEYLKQEFVHCYLDYQKLWQSSIGNNQYQKTALKNAKIAFALINQNTHFLSRSKDPVGKTVTVYEYV